jgi:hypothetical protein
MKPRARPAAAARIVEHPDATLLDLVDNLLNKGVLVCGDVVLALANVDLVYLQLSVLFCAADRVTERAWSRERTSAPPRR